jgi:hypothetical protein
VFTYPGVTAREIEPWHEDGETWRRLAVTFPPAIANHNPDQVFYYDQDVMQRRMDYSPDVTGNPRIAHYTRDPKTFDGFVFTDPPAGAPARRSGQRRPELRPDHVGRRARDRAIASTPWTRQRPGR